MTSDVETAVLTAEREPATGDAPKPPAVEIFSDLEMTHGHQPREMTNERVHDLSGHADPGKFGRMFPKLKALVVDDDALFELAQAMADNDAEGLGGDNAAIPAGFTYLGQFVDHDITLDLTPLGALAADPKATENFRTPALDLDALYGLGSAQQPYLFQRDAKGNATAKMLIGSTSVSPSPGGVEVPALPNDLPRNSVGRALIGDERNDENLLVSQTHLAFLKFHNAIVDWLVARDPSLKGPALFNEARRLATWHYQWIVLYDFVEGMTEKGLINRIREQGRKFYRFKQRPYIPVEFSAAAYRLGHSMVREAYDHNRAFNSGDDAFANGTLKFLFIFTGKSGAILGDMAPEGDPNAFVPVGPQEKLPSNWVIDWRRFFDFGQTDVKVNATRLLDPFIVPSLHSLPGNDDPRTKVLPFRNLKRGVALRLPSGQDVADLMGVKALTPDEVAQGPDGEVAKRHGMHERTPLWYYILKEAQVRHGGRRLGPVGTNIVAETFLGLVHGDQDSFMWRKTAWKPELPRAKDDTFTMVDLLNFVGDVNPVG